MVSLPRYPQQPGPPACLVPKPVLLFLPNDAGQGASKWQKPNQLCVAVGEPLPARGRGREQWLRRPRGEKFPAISGCVSEISVCGLCPAAKNKTGFQWSLVMSLVQAPQRNVVPWEMLFLYRNLLSHHLETPVTFVNLLGPRCCFWPGRLTIEQTTEMFI